MEYENIILEKKNGIATITINRPQVRNALNKQSWMEIQKAVEEVKRDNEVKVLIITGAGDKAFVAGADINELHARTMLEALDALSQSILWEIDNLPKPVIAAVNGYALGGGCELAMACDIRIASERARFGQPEVGLGLLAGAGGTQRLPRLVGIGKAKELLFTGDIIDAAEAKEIGLVNKVVPGENLMQAAQEMAEKIMSKAPLAIRLTKAAINAGANMDMRAALALERLCQTVLFTTADRKEGTGAFLEKRKPQFKGE
jgi:enoyl-CoA hydratase